MQGYLELGLRALGQPDRGAARHWCELCGTNFGYGPAPGAPRDGTIDLIDALADPRVALGGAGGGERDDDVFSNTI
jgi:hypothetical protein